MIFDLFSVRGAGGVATANPRDAVDAELLPPWEVFLIYLFADAFS